MIKIKLEKYRGSGSTTFTDRDWGERARKDIGLDAQEDAEETIELVVPANTTSFNPSFFLGLLFDSYVKFGEKAYTKKFVFVFEGPNRDEEMIEWVRENLADGHRQALDELQRFKSKKD